MTAGVKWTDVQDSQRNEISKPLTRSRFRSKNRRFEGCVLCRKSIPSSPYLDTIFIPTFSPTLRNSTLWQRFCRSRHELLSLKARHCKACCYRIAMLFFLKFLVKIVPFGVADSPVSIKVLDHYDDLIKTCLQYGIKPIVTLVHVDAPTSISLDKDLTADYLYYAKQSWLVKPNAFHVGLPSMSPASECHMP